MTNNKFTFWKFLWQNTKFYWAFLAAVLCFLIYVSIKEKQTEDLTLFGLWMLFISTVVVVGHYIQYRREEW